MQRVSKREFNELQKMWYKKLEDSGFVDIESPQYKYNTAYIKRSCRDLGFGKFQLSTYEYFSRCRQFLHEGIFASELDQTIWELYAEGLSLRQIIRHPALTEQGIVRSVFWIHSKVANIKADMAFWLKLQLEKEELEELGVAND